jgi:hypothetical protein
MFSITLSEDIKLKISITKGITIYVYCSNGITLRNTFSARKTANYFNVSKNTILYYTKNR